MNSVFFLSLCFLFKGSLNIPGIQMFDDWSCTVLVRNRTCCENIAHHRFQSISVTLYKAAVRNNKYNPSS